MSALISILRAAKVIPFSLSVDNQELNSAPLWVLQMVEEEVFKLFVPPLRPLIHISYTTLICIQTNYIAFPAPPSPLSPPPLPPLNTVYRINQILQK